MAVVATISAGSQSRRSHHSSSDASSGNNTNSQMQSQQQQPSPSLSHTSFPQADAAVVKSIRLQDAVAPEEPREYRFSHETLPKQEILAGVLFHIQETAPEFFTTEGRSTAMMVFVNAIERQSRPEISGVGLYDVLKEVDRMLTQDGATMLANVPNTVLTSLESSYDQTVRIISDLWSTIRQEYGIGEASRELLEKCDVIQKTRTSPQVGEEVSIADRVASIDRALELVPEVCEFFTAALQKAQPNLDPENLDQAQFFVKVAQEVGVLLAHSQEVRNALGSIDNRIAELQEGFKQVIGAEGAEQRADFYKALTAVINVALPEYIGQDLELQAHVAQQSPA